MRITVRVVQAAAVAALAVLAVGCGSSGDTGRNGSGVIDQVININWGAEPPSLDPGPRDGHDVRRRDHEHHGSARQARQGSRAHPESREVVDGLRRREDRHLQAPRRRPLDERRPRHRAGLRVVVEAHDLAGARGRLRVPVLRDRRSGRVQRVQGELRRAPRQGRREGARRPHAAGGAHVTAAVVRAAGRPPVVPRGPSGRRSRSSAASGPTRRTSSPTGRSSSRAGPTTPGSTSSSGMAGGTPTR